MGPIQPPNQRVLLAPIPKLFRQGVKLTAHPHLVAKLGTSRATFHSHIFLYGAYILTFHLVKVKVVLTCRHNINSNSHTTDSWRQSSNKTTTIKDYITTVKWQKSKFLCYSILNVWNPWRWPSLAETCRCEKTKYGCSPYMMV
jgi:hypothetical protein